jgi:hypothetical protein
MFMPCLANPPGKPRVCNKMLIKSNQCYTCSCEAIASHSLVDACGCGFRPWHIRALWLNHSGNTSWLPQLTDTERWRYLSLRLKPYHCCMSAGLQTCLLAVPAVMAVETHLNVTLGGPDRTSRHSHAKPSGKACTQQHSKRVASVYDTNEQNGPTTV